MTLRKAAAGLVAIGLMVGLLGAGISAQWSDGATAAQNIRVGTFDIEISSSAPNAVVVNDTSVVPHVHSVTLTADDILGSPAGTRPLPFEVKSLGSIPVKIHVTQTVPMLPFTSMLADPVADVTLAQNESHLYAGGLRWPMLVNADLNKVATITYTAAALEAGGIALPGGSAVTLTGSTIKSASYAVGAPPVVNAQLQTITWTTTVNTPATPQVCNLSCYLGYIDDIDLGRYTATAAPGSSIFVRVTATPSASLASQASKFSLMYRSNAMGSYPVVGPLPVTDLSVTSLIHHATDNGFGVKWSGLTGGATGTVTITLSFVAQP